MSQRFPIRLDAFVVMPNHLHAIVLFTVLPPRPQLGDVVRWFKTMTTNEYIRRVRRDRWRPFPGRLWLRGYHDRLIRDSGALNSIRAYVRSNPGAATNR